MKLCSNGHDVDVVGFYYSNGKNGRVRRCKACKKAESARYVERRSARRRRRRLGLGLGLGEESAPKPRRVWQRTGTGKPPISAASSDLMLELYARAETLPHWERLTLYKRAAAIAEGGDE